MTLTWNITWKHAIISVAIPKFCNQKKASFPEKKHWNPPTFMEKSILTPNRNPTYNMHNFVAILVLTKWQNSPSMGLGLHVGVTYDPIALPFQNPRDLWFLRPRHTVLGRRSPRRYLVRPGWTKRMPGRLEANKPVVISLTFWRVLVANFLGLLSIDV